jgi:Fe-S cluster assembly iron-binding protein IscA
MNCTLTESAAVKIKEIMAHEEDKTLKLACLYLTLTVIMHITV